MMDGVNVALAEPVAHKGNSGTRTVRVDEALQALGQLHLIGLNCKSTHVRRPAVRD